MPAIGRTLPCSQGCGLLSPSVQSCFDVQKSHRYAVPAIRQLLDPYHLTSILLADCPWRIGKSDQQLHSRSIMVAAGRKKDPMTIEVYCSLKFFGRLVARINRPESHRQRHFEAIAASGFLWNWLGGIACRDCRPGTIHLCAHLHLRIFSTHYRGIEPPTMEPPYCSKLHSGNDLG